MKGDDQEPDRPDHRFLPKRAFMRVRVRASFLVPGSLLWAAARNGGSLPLGAVGIAMSGTVGRMGMNVKYLDDMDMGGRRDVQKWE